MLNELYDVKNAEVLETPAPPKQTERTYHFEIIGRKRIREEPSQHEDTNVENLLNALNQRRLVKARQKQGTYQTLKTPRQILRLKQEALKRPVITWNRIQQLSHELGMPEKTVYKFIFDTRV